MSKQTVLALVGGVAVLVLGVFYWTADSASDPASFDGSEIRVSRRGAVAERGRDGRVPRERRGGPRARSESRGDAESAPEDVARDERGARHRRLPAANGDAESRRVERPGGGNNPGPAPQAGSARSSALLPGGGGAGGGITRPRLPRAEDGEHDRPDLPKASDRDPAQADGDPEAVDDVAAPPAEPIREIAYEQDPDRLFDTGVPMEVQGAGRISPDGGMVSVWIQPEWSNNKEDSADLMRLGESGLQLLKEGSFLRFQFTDANGNEQGGDADIGQWQDGEWHHVVATWTDNGMYLYVDGGQAFANQGVTRPPAQSDPRLFVGSAYPEGTGIALAAMANLTVVNRTPSEEELKKLFEAGGPTRK